MNKATKTEQEEIETLLSESAKQMKSITADKDCDDVTRIAAFKALTAYYNSRWGKKPPTPPSTDDDADPLPTFEQLQRTIEGAGNGRDKPIRGS